MRAWDSLCTMREDMGVRHLAVDEGDTQRFGVSAEMSESYFGAIGFKREHGLSAKEVANADSVESAQEGACWCVDGEARRGLSCVEIGKEAAKNGG